MRLTLFVFHVHVKRYNAQWPNPIFKATVLDYLREGFPWPAQPFKHTESNSFKHTVTTFKYTNWYESYYLRGLAVWPALHIFKCRYRI
jgi:hypothetical protein